MKHVDSDKKYDLSRCDKEEKASFATKIYNLSKLTWGEIDVQPRDTLGYHKIPQDEIRKDMPAHVTPDISMLAFRFHKKKTMVGYRKGDVLYLIWFDRKFKLYDHGS